MKISGGGATQMDELYLNDLLRFSREEMERVKVRFNLQPKGGQDPMELYLENHEKVNTEWLLAKKKKGFFQEGEIAVALVRLDDQGRWLLTTIKRITKALDASWNSMRRTLAARWCVTIKHNRHRCGVSR